MASLGTGLIVSGIISGLSNLFGASQASSASTEAAQVMAQAANNALQFEESVYQDQTQRQAPWVSMGTAALSKLGSLMGLSPAAVPTYQAPALSPSTPGWTPASVYYDGPSGGGAASGSAGGPYGSTPSTGNGDIINPWEFNNDPSLSPTGGDASAAGFFSGNPGGAFYGGEVPGSGGDQAGGGDQQQGGIGRAKAKSMPVYPLTTSGQPTARGGPVAGVPLSLSDVGTGSDANGAVSVTDPTGTVHTFPSRIQAYAFAKQAGLV